MAKANEAAAQMYALVKDLPRDQQLAVLRAAAEQTGVDFDKVMKERQQRARTHRRGRGR